MNTTNYTNHPLHDLSVLTLLNSARWRDRLAAAQHLNNDGILLLAGDYNIGVREYIEETYGVVSDKRSHPLYQ